ncbi:MAG: YgaP-like transmembrane domain [Trueperaceae bacterium]
MAILGFLSSTTGRWARVLVGALLVVIGAVAGGWATLLAVVGAVFVLVGALDVCLLAPLFGKPLSGKAFRAAQRG